MPLIKKILLALLAVFVIIQFIRPPSLTVTTLPQNTIGAKFHVPADIQKVFQHSCYDCHSNTTNFPWYASVQPVGWWLNGHINDGRRQLNFDEFATYRPVKQYRKLDDIREQVEDGDMPLPAYTLIHRSAALSQEERERVSSWASAMRDSMQQWFPPDSLKWKPRGE